MYTYNVLFDWNRNDGCFSVQAGAGVLNKSKHWLRLDDAEPNNPNPPMFNPEAAPWEDLGDSTLFVHASSNPGELCIRVAEDLPGNRQPIQNATLQLAVCFGRPVKARQLHASPLRCPLGPSDPTPVVRTTFISQPIPKNTGGGWFFPLGAIDTASKPKHPNKIHQFEFAVGIIVKSNGETRYYGEDPEGDIGD